MQFKWMLLVATSILGGRAAMAKADVLLATLSELDFAFDSSVLPTNAPQELGRVVDYAMAHPDLLIVLDGHADPIGTEQYNVGLSIRRADAVRDALIARGIENDRVVIAAFGKDGPRRPTYAEDRRVTLWTTHNSIASIIEGTFDKQGTSVTWEKPLTTAQIETPGEPIASR